MNFNRNNFSTPSRNTYFNNSDFSNDWSYQTPDRRPTNNPEYAEHRRSVVNAYLQLENDHGHLRTEDHLIQEDPRTENHLMQAFNNIPDTSICSLPGQNGYYSYTIVEDCIILILIYVSNFDYSDIGVLLKRSPEGIRHRANKLSTLTLEEIKKLFDIPRKKPVEAYAESLIILPKGFKTGLATGRESFKLNSQLRQIEHLRPILRGFGRSLFYTDPSTPTRGEQRRPWMDNFEGITEFVPYNHIIEEYLERNACLYSKMCDTFTPQFFDLEALDRIIYTVAALNGIHYADIKGMIAHHVGSFEFHHLQACINGCRYIEKSVKEGSFIRAPK